MFTYGSVCSGIESASVAWEPLGLVPKWFSEIEPFPCALLSHRWPHVPNWGDMSQLPDAVRYGVVSAPDILIGGTPCQAFSVAGKRQSLADARGGLSLIYGDLLNAIDEQRGEGNEAVCVWENVPGVLSTSDNAFGQFLGLLAGEYTLADCLSGRAVALEAQPGDDRQKWPKSGCVIGPVRTVAWRVLDAQYFGVAQRRKRVFVVASARRGFDPASVLFEREGVRRDSAPSRETGQEVTGGFGKSFAENSRGEVRLEGGDGSLSGCLSTGGGKPGQGIPAVLLQGSHWDDSRNAHPTLNQLFNTGGIGASNQEIFSQRGSGIVPTYTSVSHCLNAGAQQRNDYETETFVLARNERSGRATSEAGLQDVTMSITASYGTGGADLATKPLVCKESVRRLTPVECERLQGFPDNHTLLPFGAKQRVDAELQAYYERHLGRSLTVDEYRAFVSDGPRYKAIGNSKAVPVVQWVGMRIMMGLLK
ncbi:putative methylase [Vibrio phage VpaJT_1]|nr:putative methylase [Vibrio phage VpaJT_1]